MIGKLIQVATATHTTGQATVSLTGIDDNSVYVCVFYNLKTTNDAKNMRFRVTKASDSSADSTTNYNKATRSLRTDTGFNNGTGIDSTSWSISNTGTGTEELTNGILHLYQFFDSGHDSYISDEVIYRHSSGSTLFGQMGGGVHNVHQSNNGIQFFENGGDTFTGTFTLYKVV